MLPHSLNVNIQHRNIISTPSPDPRVEPVFQPLRVQTQESETTPPPIENPSSPPSLDPHSNPSNKRLKKYKETPQILKARYPQEAPRKVHHQLHRSPRNVGTNLRTQATLKLFTNQLFKLPHAYHVHNNQGGKETIYTLLMGDDINTWRKDLGNELRRLSNEIDNQVRETNTI